MRHSCEGCKDQNTVCMCASCNIDEGEYKNWQPKTRYDRIMAEMTPKKLAKLIIEPLQMANGELFWHTSAGGRFGYDEALQAQVDWLMEVDE